LAGIGRVMPGALFREIVAPGRGGRYTR